MIISNADRETVEALLVKILTEEVPTALPLNHVAEHIADRLFAEYELFPRQD